MAFRSSATTTQATGVGTTLNVNMPAGLTSGDQILCMVSVDSFSSTNTAPAGWTQIGNSNMASPDGQNISLFTRIANGTEGTTQAWTVASKGAVAICGCWSGRTASALTSSNVVVTTNTTSNTSPISESLSGVTSSSGDDIAAFVALDETAAAATWSWTGITNYTNQNTANSGDASVGNFQYRNNVSGATGTLTDTVTRTGGTGNAGYAGFVVNIPAVAAPSDTLMGQICL